ncbi:alpha/beta hydrolase [Rhodovulum iodosum]|uniref:alpha/beta hydrolase n=1 Tax=Rhodovulum iodosum TaxID=68291 RepID=UPI000F66E513|nr:alpha/beta hydrolase [Rhodovulum robiginosum]RSK31611.1 alpha/beta hydrolase [Rhodovulum robiginosum]
MDWDDAYANMPHIPGGADYPPRWAAAAEAFRATVRGETDLPYGDHPRQRFDLFLPEGAPRGLAVFVHGGYWLRFDKSLWSHLAAGPLARGWAVAMPSYRLAPEVAISQITADVARALPDIAARVDGPVALAGHSAGGHLVARMLCEDVALTGDVSARIQRAVSISPVSDLRPLRNTAMNADFKLTEEAARAESPVFHRPRPDVPVQVWVGGDERPVFLDQARWLAEAWPGAQLTVVPGKHHFDVIEGLEAPDSPLTEALLGGL